jgi:hypothetical protein
MVKNDQQEAFEKILTSNLMRAIDFVKFAEAKNAALLTFNSAWFLALFNTVNSNSIINNRFLMITTLSMSLIALSAISSILSFLPKTAVSYFTGTNHRSRNLLFVGDIATMLVPDLKANLVARYRPNDGESITEDYVSDLVEQIGINSKIAMRKFRSFNRGAALTLVGLGILSLPYLAHAVKILKAKFGM